MIDIYKTWADFKTEYTARALQVQWYSADDKYYIYGKDGYLMFSCEIAITDPAGTDQEDFEGYMPVADIPGK